MTKSEAKNEIGSTGTIAESIEQYSSNQGDAKLSNV
jgi:hypothetical protein